MSKRAVFLDRDQTIIADPGFIDDPDQVTLLPGAAESIRLLNDADLTVVVATNQSGVARGLVSEEQLSEIHQRLREMLLEQGARIDAIYYCPYLNGPQAVVEQYRQASDLRKPKPGMLLRAAEELELSLHESWMIGDSARDVIAGARAGCRTILVPHEDGGAADEPCQPDFVATTLREAAELVIASPQTPPPPEEVSKPPISEPCAEAEAPSTGEADTGALLAEIRDMLRRRERRDRQEDFSVARLTATLAQMLALVAGAWAFVAVFGDPTTALARFALAILLQLIALTALSAGGRR